MQIKVNVHIMGMKPGDIVKEGDRLFGDFKGWAARGDTRNGSVICEVYTPSAAAASEGDDASMGAVDDGSDITPPADEFSGDDVADPEARKAAEMKRARLANGRRK